jgi:hypothetical protein
MHFRQPFSRAMQSEPPVTVNRAPTRARNCVDPVQTDGCDSAARNLHNFKTTVRIA